MMNKNQKLLFTISVLGNVLLAGALGGVIVDRPHDMPWERVKEGLSEESQKLVSKMFQDNWKDMGSIMRQSMDNRKYLADVIRADKFDPEEFDEAVQRIQGVQSLMTKKKIQSTKELLMKLPDEDRKKLADPVANSFSWKGTREAHRHDHPMPSEKGDKPVPSPADPDDKPE